MRQKLHCLFFNGSDDNIGFPFNISFYDISESIFCKFEATTHAEIVGKVFQYLKDAKTRVKRKIVCVDEQTFVKYAYICIILLLFSICCKFFYFLILCLFSLSYELLYFALLHMLYIFCKQFFFTISKCFIIYVCFFLHSYILLNV